MKESLNGIVVGRVASDWTFKMLVAKQNANVTDTPLLILHLRYIINRFFQPTKNFANNVKTLRTLKSISLLSLFRYIKFIQLILN